MSRESQHTSRAWWPLFGLAAVALGHTATWMAQFALSPDELRVGGQVMFDAYNDDGTELLFRLSAGMGMLGIAALVVFGAGFRRMLEQRVPRESLLPAVAGNALIATAGALLVAFVFRAMVFDTIAEYGVDAQVTTYSLSQNVPLAAWVGVGVAEVVTAIAAFSLRRELSSSASFEAFTNSWASAFMWAGSRATIPVASRKRAPR